MASDEVLRAIPHRPPFLFIDEVVERGESSLTARRYIGPDEPFFEGHYPGNPIMPGVLISEAVVQAGAILLADIMKDETERGDDVVPVLTKISDARFRAMVKPGETIYLTAKFKEKMGGFVFMEGAARTESGKRIMSLSYSVALRSTNGGA